MASASTAYATTFWLRHPDSPWRFAVIGGVVALTGVTGYGRIGGGWHFYTDVFAGAAIGATAGLVVPALHRKHLEVAVAPLSGGASVAVAGAF